MKKYKTMRGAKYQVARRSDDSICEQYASRLEIGDRFKYKDFACTVTALSKNIVTFVGERGEKVGTVIKEMRLNAESFNTAVEERRIKLAKPQKASIMA